MGFFNVSIIMNRVAFTLLGYVLFALGVLSLILGSIGLRLQPISLIDENFSPLMSFVIKIVIMIIGIVLFYRSRINPEDYE